MKLYFILFNSCFFHNIDSILFFPLSFHFTLSALEHFMTICKHCLKKKGGVHILLYEYQRVCRQRCMHRICIGYAPGVSCGLVSLTHWSLDVNSKQYKHHSGVFTCYQLANKILISSVTNYF